MSPAQQYCSANFFFSFWNIEAIDQEWRKSLVDQGDHRISIKMYWHSIIIKSTTYTAQTSQTSVIVYSIPALHKLAKTSAQLNTFVENRLS